MNLKILRQPAADAWSSSLSDMPHIEPLLRAHATAPHSDISPISIRIRIVFCLFGIDLISILAGISIVAFLRSAVLGGTDVSYLLATIVPIYLFVSLNTHAYSIRDFDRPLELAVRGIRTLTMAIVSVIFIAFMLKTSENVTRLVTVLGYLVSAGMMALGRYTFARHCVSIVGGSPSKVFLIRDKNSPEPEGNFSVILNTAAWFEPDTHDPVIYDRIAKMLTGADRVVVSCPQDRRVAWAHALKSANIQAEIVVPEIVALEPLGVATMGSTVTIVVATGPLELSDRVVKRMFDIIVAGVFIVTLLPLLVSIAIAIKLDSRGPILFRQARIGRGNKIFNVIKFRSMRVDLSDEAGNISASRDDNRVTRVGRVIRSTSLDELPQLFNVLIGDMSIVGPRPHALGSRAADKLFWEIDSRYWHRHAAKPGLTGLAQVRGFRGATLVESDLANRLQSDLEYLENWSLWRDIKLVLLTLRVLAHRNAF